MKSPIGPSDQRIPTELALFRAKNTFEADETSLDRQEVLSYRLPRKSSPPLAIQTSLCLLPLNIKLDYYENRFD